MWTPSSRPSASVTSFTRPSVSPRIIARASPAKRCVGDHDVVPGLARLLLGEPAPRDLGMRVDDPRDLPVVDRRDRLAEDGLHDHDRLREADVRELRRVDHVAGGEHPGARSCAAGRRRRRSRGRRSSTPAASRPKPRAQRRPPDAHDDLVDDDRLLAGVGLPRDRELACALDAGDARRRLHVDAALLERARDDVAGVLVGAARGCAAAPRAAVTSLPMSTSIDANSTPITPPPMIATRGGTSVELEHVVGREHARAVEVEPGQGTRVRARSRSRGCRPAPRCRRRARTVCAAASVTSPRALHTVTLRPLSSDSVPFVRRSTTSCLRACARPRSSVGTPASTPKSGAPLDRAQDLGGLEELLGRDAPPVEARPADPVLLHQRDVQARRRRRTARSRIRPDHHRGPRCRIARPERPPPRTSPAGAPRRRPVVTCGTPPFFQAEPRVRSIRSEHSLDRHGHGLDPPRSGGRVSGRAGSGPRRRRGSPHR